MTVCVRRPHRRFQRVQPLPEKLSVEQELQLLRAIVVMLQVMGLMDHDVLEPTKRLCHSQSEYRRA